MAIIKKTTKKANKKTEENQSHTLKKNNAEKRKPKGPITFKLQLNEEQKEAKKLMLGCDITVLLGRAGSGKTFAGVQLAADLFFNREVERIRITRPTVSDEELGFLPGDLKEKLDPWLQPIYHNFYQLVEKKKIQEMIKADEIIISPIAFMRGITYLNECLITGERLLTDDGWKNIEDVYTLMETGNLINVLSFNEKTHEQEYKELSIIKKTAIKDYVKVELKDGTITNVSKGHKFYTDNGITEVAELSIGCKIKSIEGFKEVINVDTFKCVDFKYSLNIEDNHNYFSTGGLLSKNCVIVDEAQNITISQIKMIVTRLGKGSKLIFCGDTNQIDLKRKKDSGLGYLIEAGKNIKGFAAIELHTNHRHGIVDKFLDSFEHLDNPLSDIGE